MSVADEDIVRLYRVGRDGSSRIPTKERINDDLISIGFESKSCMSIPG
jgi:hypothetical protein